MSAHSGEIAVGSAPHPAPLRPEPPRPLLAQLSWEEAGVMARIVANKYRREQGIPPKSLWDEYA
jgi:hypothetical protein